MTGGPISKQLGEVKRLTEKELQEKKAKGLCFRCDDKWSIGHHCRKKELSVLLMGDEEEEETEGSNSELLAKEITPELSLNSVIGLSNPKTMKLLGLVGEETVVVMVDPGATHNFLSLQLVEKLKIPVTESGNFGVSLGNGEAIRGSGVCKGVMLHLEGGVEVYEDFLPLTLGNSNVILGVQWLKKLGPVVTNWKTQEMSFEMGDNTVTMKSDPSLVRAKVSLKAMIRNLRNVGGGFWVECNQLESQGTAKTSVEERFNNLPREIRETVNQFEKVFQQPQGLPPQRGHEHTIVLKQGSNPVSVHPYRYPQNQKDEIERLIREMLATGLIKPSTSPFSSPVLLVKKKMVPGGSAWTTAPLKKRQYRTSIPFR